MQQVIESYRAWSWAMAVALLASPRHGKHQAAPLSRFGREMGLGDRAGPPRRCCAQTHPIRDRPDRGRGWK